MNVTVVNVVQKRNNQFNSILKSKLTPDPSAGNSCEEKNFLLTERNLEKDQTDTGT